MFYVVNFFLDMMRFFFILREMTVHEILESLDAVKPMSRPTLYRWIKNCRIKPVGARQIPQHYPSSTPVVILKKLGLNGKIKNRN